MSEEAKKKLMVQVPTEIVRNQISGMVLNANEFHLYAVLCFLHFRTYEIVNGTTVHHEELKIDHKELMYDIKINDARTLRKYLDKLHNLNLIKEKVGRFPRKGSISIVFNSKPFESKHFTQLPVQIFTWINRLDTFAIRLLFYYKSHINYKTGKDSAFPSFETISQDLSCSFQTIDEANQLLERHKLLKVKRSDLHCTYEYAVSSDPFTRGEIERMVYRRFPNFYYVKEDKI